MFKVNEICIGVINLLGRTFLSTVDCPFRTTDNLLKEIQEQTNIIIVDFHAETTSEKMALGWFLDGRVSAVCGTHTHVQTADERILPGGTAYITDLGMTGPKNSVLGIDKELVIKKFLTQLPVRFALADGPQIFNGVVIDVDQLTGRAVKIERIFIAN